MTNIIATQRQHTSGRGQSSRIRIDKLLSELKDLDREIRLGGRFKLIEIGTSAVPRLMKLATEKPMRGEEERQLRWNYLYILEQIALNTSRRSNQPPLNGLRETIEKADRKVIYQITKLVEKILIDPTENEGSLWLQGEEFLERMDVLGRYQSPIISINEFLVRAKLATYASDKKTGEIKLDNGKHGFVFESGRFRYEDWYHGSDSF